MSTPPPEPGGPASVPNPYAPQSPSAATPPVAPAPYSPPTQATHYVGQNQYAGHYPPPQGVAYAAAPRRGLSITAMVLGIVGIVGMIYGGFMLSIGAIIFGHIGRKKEPAGRGMALAGLVTGYIGAGCSIAFALIFVLVFIVPALLLLGAAGSGL